MKIFYSWQMDSPRKINKDFIHDALMDAVSRIGERHDVSQVKRDEIVVDQDTQGVLGSPEISRVIFEKIQASDVVVTDVSIVALNADGKAHINSNVAIELGYAYGKLGDAAVLKIMNTHFGPPTILPFDLRIRRHPVQYELEPNATKETISLERGKLAGRLSRILLEYQNIPRPTSAIPHSEVPFIDSRGKYWENHEPIVRGDESRGTEDMYWSHQSFLYFRCIPSIELPEVTVKDAYELMAELTPLGSAGGRRNRNKWGAVLFEKDGAGELIEGVQIHRNGEIWAVDALCASCQTQVNDEDEEPKTYIPTEAVQKDYPRSIDKFRSVAKKLGYGERYTVELGVSNADGIFLASGYYDSFLGPFYQQEVFFRKVISDDYPTMKFMNEFWNKLFSEVGRNVPKELHWAAAAD